MEDFRFKDKSLKELFALLKKDDAKEIVRIACNVDHEKTKHWRIEKNKDSYRICMTDEKAGKDLGPENSTIIVLTDSLDIYQQSLLPKPSKMRVGNLFAVYQYLSGLLSQKLEKVAVC